MSLGRLDISLEGGELDAIERIKQPASFQRSPGLDHPFCHHPIVVQRRLPFARRAQFILWPYRCGLCKVIVSKVATVQHPSMCGRFAAQLPAEFARSSQRAIPVAILYERTAYARSCVAEAETAVRRQEMSVTRQRQAGLSSLFAEHLLVELDRYLQIFWERLAKLEERRPV